MSEAGLTITPGLYIRHVVFGVKTQDEWAKLLGCSQATASRYDNGHPLSRRSQNRVIELARKRGIDFDPVLFWKVPETYSAPQVVEAA